MGKGAKRVSKSTKKHDTDESEGDKSSDNDASSSVANTSVAADRSDDSNGISESVEKLSEKRASYRESGLKSLLKVLRGSNEMTVESVRNFIDTICSAISRMLRRPASLEEGTLCLQLYCLICLLVGPDEVELFDQFEPTLLKLVNGMSDFDELRVTSLAALAFSSYICACEAHYRIMTLCEDILCDESEGEPATAILKARAAASWTFLASINSETVVLGRCKARVFEEVVLLLEDNESDVKISAGLTLAALWEIADNVVPEVDYAVSGLELCGNPAKISQAVALLQKVAKESSKRISKKDKKEQVCLDLTYYALLS